MKKVLVMILVVMVFISSTAMLVFAQGKQSPTIDQGGLHMDSEILWWGHYNENMTYTYGMELHYEIPLGQSFSDENLDVRHIVYGDDGRLEVGEVVENYSYSLDENFLTIKIDDYIDMPIFTTFTSTANINHECEDEEICLRVTVTGDFEEVFGCRLIVLENNGVCPIPDPVEPEPEPVDPIPVPDKPTLGDSGNSENGEENTEGVTPKEPENTKISQKVTVRSTSKSREALEKPDTTPKENIEKLRPKEKEEFSIPQEVVTENSNENPQTGR